MNNSTGATRLQYRLLADGTIIDQKTGKVVDYVTSQSDIERLWTMNNMQRQRILKEMVEK